MTTFFHTSFARAALVLTFGACTSSALAAPGPTNNASCGLRNADAAINTMVPAEWPQIALDQGAQGTALVRIDLRENGTVRNAAIFSSTGNELLDKAAQSASLKQKYSPEVRDCLNVTGTYLVRVDFSS